jgi:hypoxanthine phosphoribosyltransferase
MSIDWLRVAAPAAVMCAAAWWFTRERKQGLMAEEEVDEFLSKQQDRSGKLLKDSKSEYFSNVKDYKLIMTKAELAQAVERVAREIESQTVGEKIVICGILKGAFVFVKDLSQTLNRPNSIYFVEASSYSGQEQSEGVELLSRIVPSKFEGRKIVLVDELLDNGKTMATMVDHLMKELKVPRTQIITCVLMSKERPKRPKSWEADITGIANLPDVWLVGYGLDDNGTKRGWPILFACPKAPGVPKEEADKIFNDDEEGKAAHRRIRMDVQGASQ